jgi:hypothetical protein
MSKSVLNVGAGRADAALPPYYHGWKNVRLDVDPRHDPDVLLDARQLDTLPPALYDAVLCSHNLEHYHRHEAAKVVRGMLHVLKPDGFAEVRVPDLAVVMRRVVEKNLDIDDVLYTATAGPILVRDVLYGYHVEIEASQNDFYGHKTGFTPRSLWKFFLSNGFAMGAVATMDVEVVGFFFRQMPTPEQQRTLPIGIPPQPQPPPAA